MAYLNETPGKHGWFGKRHDKNDVRTYVTMSTRDGRERIFALHNDETRAVLAARPRYI